MSPAVIRLTSEWRQQRIKPKNQMDIYGRVKAFLRDAWIEW